MIQKIKKYSTTNRLVLLGMILGLLFGIFLPQLALKQQIIGQIFISFLKMLVVPLVFSSVYVAIAGLGNLESLKDIGLKTVGLYILTTALATFTAIAIMNIIPIGNPTSIEGLEYAKASQIASFSFTEMILSFIPTNIFNALSEGSMMQIIIFSALFAIASLHLKKERQELIVDFFTAVTNAMLIMAEWVIKMTPIGVFSLISYVIAEQGIEVVINLWKYMAMVIAVLLIHVVITLPLILALLGRINPFKYLSDIREAPIMAFSTASSTATLPVSMRVVEEVGGVDRKNASFVLPLGATVSMDGTAAYLSVAVLYIANLAGVDLSFGTQLLLGVTVIALSVGVAALPSASLVMMVVILNQLGLATEYIALIIAVDRILDMARTSINVTSDLVVVKIIDQLQKFKKQNV
ncbi:MAG: sodium:dicarboxylate symporter [Sulfurimonas sp. RIFOXYD12_FULL_33_39]|uniref:dicarboxylate/amino acid:cation symporter n=1 Tax=unclassified Sulfurimonas TaxID=2623549 RepID=UPI0008C73EE1|nr:MULTISPECIES: dicarboxylate/amino acid:cation symporter [unclassified Sulfurimonas]OHE09889.1 MAG: sodium:dicarboxylate symporter [Sulfurimonas sp. RIFOXYD12_FULL_33_39]OHE13603.1 MAG: sodium:dicarboxylate symporter [Sulfurimonas sp. RIFOXYD2_FULL_34_21]DAB28204.1 MAG TPA: sodium:dicarboxylate symporter [Sulfurimonas sp. UBA10385]